MQWCVASAVWTVNFLTTNMRRMSTVKYHKALESYRCLKRIHTHTHTHTDTQTHIHTHTHTNKERRLCCVVNVGGGSGERETRHDTSVLRREGGQCVNRVVRELSEMVSEQRWLGSA